MVANGNINLNKFQHNIWCAVFLLFFSFHFAPFKLDAGITKLCAVHSLCMLQRFDLYTITKRYIKIWKKNKQCNAVSWLLTPFLDCTYDEKSYLFACSRATIIFSNPCTKKIFKRKTSVGNKNIEKKKNHFTTWKAFFTKTSTKSASFFCIPIDLMFICSAAIGFYSPFSKVLLISVYFVRLCRLQFIWFFPLFILQMAMQMRSFLLLLFQIVSSIQSFFNPQMLNLIIFLTVLWVGKFSCLSNRWKFGTF